MLCFGLNNHLKGYEKSSQKVCIFCAETVKKNVQLFLNIFFYIENCVATSSCISFFFKNGRLVLKRYLTTASERKKNVLLGNFVGLRNILNSKID